MTKFISIIHNILSNISYYNLTVNKINFNYLFIVVVDNIDGNTVYKDVIKFDHTKLTFISDTTNEHFNVIDCKYLINNIKSLLTKITKSNNKLKPTKPINKPVNVPKFNDNRIIPTIDNDTYDTEIEEKDNDDNDDIEIEEKDIDEMNEDELNEYLKSLEKLKEEQNNKISLLKNQYKDDTKNYSKFVTDLNEEKRIDKQIKDKIQQDINKFNADKKAYYNMKDDGKTADTVADWWREKYLIFQKMDEDETLNKDGSFDIYKQLLSRLPNNDEEVMESYISDNVTKYPSADEIINNISDDEDIPNFKLKEK
jgi:hypothetical protein